MQYYLSQTVLPYGTRITLFTIDNVFKFVTGRRYTATTDGSTQKFMKVSRKGGKAAKEDEDSDPSIDEDDD